MFHYVAYYRVSTDKQGKSGLGLDAQRETVAQFVAGRGEIVAAFTEIESTRKQRPELHAALDACRKYKAILLIARLDRLARNVAFISNLMESRVEFVAADMPAASRLTIHILAAVAEHEREMISERTRAALKAARARGIRLGNPNPHPASLKGIEALKTRKQEFHAAALPLIQDLKKQGYTLSGIASRLNALHISSARGKQWYATTVRNILRCETSSQPVYTAT